MKPLSFAVLALVIVAPLSAEAAPMTPANAVPKLRPLSRSVPARHWLSDGLQGLSLLLPRHAASNRNSG